MRGFSLRLTVALATFVIGVNAVSAWVFYRLQPVEDKPSANRPVATPTPYDSCLLTRTQKKLSESEAVRLAECFVVQNGYTDLPPMQDLSKLSYETFDDVPPAERALEVRRNTLERRAYGVRNGGKGGDRVDVADGWTVVFRYNPDTKGRGRAVTMDAYGNHIRMQHPDYPLSLFKKPEEYAP